MLTLNNNVTIPFPKIMDGHTASGLVYSKTTGQPALTQGAWQVSFDSAGTLKSNQAGETFDAAVARYTDDLEAMGHILR